MDVWKRHGRNNSFFVSGLGNEEEDDDEEELDGIDFALEKKFMMQKQAMMQKQQMIEKQRMMLGTTQIDKDIAEEEQIMSAKKQQMLEEQVRF